MVVGLARGAYVRTLSAVYAAMFLIRVAFGVMVVTFAGYVEASEKVYGLLLAAAPAFELVTVIFAGIFVDRYGRKGVLLTGLGLGAISLYGLALTRNVFLLGAVKAVHGVAAALILVTTLAIIATYARPDGRGQAMGFFNLANLMGWIAGFVLGSLLSDTFRDRLEYTFIVAGLLATVGLLYANRMINLPQAVDTAPGAPSHAPPSLGELAVAVGNRDIMLLTMPWLIVFTLVGAFIGFFPRVAGGLDISGAQTSLGILFVGGLMFASQWFWGRLSDKHGRETVMLIGAVGFALLMSTIMFGFFETASQDPVAVFRNVMSHWFLLGLFLFTALAFAPAGLAAIADEAKEGAQGTTMSLYSLTLSLGFIVGPPILGFVSDQFGGEGMVIFFAVLAAALLALVVTRFVQARVTKRQQAAQEGT